MNPDLILAVALAVLFVALVIFCIKDSRPKCSTIPADLAAKPVDAIELPEVSPSHDPTAIYCEPADTPDGEPKIMTVPEAIEAGAIRQQQEASSHLGYDAPEIPCPAIQEAQKRLADLPPVLSVTKPKPYRQYDADRVMQAMQRAANVALELRAHMEPKDVSDRYGYASPESMRKALNRYGYRLNGQPKEAKQDA